MLTQIRQLENKGTVNSPHIVNQETVNQEKVVIEHDLLLRPINADDLDAVVTLFKHEYGHHQLVTIENFRWQLFEHPQQPPIAWVAWHRGDDRPVAYYQLLTQNFVHQSKTFLSAYSLNTLVDKDYRKCFWRDQNTKKFVSLFPALANLAYQQALSRGVSFITALPNENSKRGFFDTLGFEKLISLDLMVHPGRPGDVLRRYLNHGILGKLSAPLANLSARLMFHSIRFSGRLLNTSVQLKPLGVEHLQVMARLTQWYRPDDITQPRSPEYLRWRYFDSPQKYTLFGIFNQAGDLMAWLAIIALQKGSEKTGYYPVGIITDIAYQDDQQGLSQAKRLVAHVCRDQTKNAGLVMILALRNPAMRSRSPFSRRFFFTMPAKLSGRELNFGIKRLSDEVPESLVTAGNWRLTFSDFDVA